MSSYSAENVRLAPAVATGNLSGADATITELDREAYGYPRFVSLVVLSGTVADTAVLDVFSVHGADSGTITPGAGNLLVAHDAVAAAAGGGNSNKEFRITVDCLNGPRYLDAIVSNNIAANFGILHGVWVMSDSQETPNTNAYGTGSPKFGVAEAAT